MQIAGTREGGREGGEDEILSIFSYRGGRVESFKSRTGKQYWSRGNLQVIEIVRTSTGGRAGIARHEDQAMDIDRRRLEEYQKQQQFFVSSETFIVHGIYRSIDRWLAEKVVWWHSHN